MPINMPFTHRADFGDAFYTGPKSEDNWAFKAIIERRVKTLYRDRQTDRIIGAEIYEHAWWPPLKEEEVMVKSGKQVVWTIEGIEGVVYVDGGRREWRASKCSWGLREA